MTETEGRERERAVAREVRGGKRTRSYAQRYMSELKPDSEKNSRRAELTSSESLLLRSRQNSFSES
jgi:hypothetical protein